MSNVKQTQFANGVPPKERNGFYGLEETLIANPTETIVVVATLKVSEVTEKQLADDIYPTVSWQTIEPIRTEAGIAAALKLRDEAKFERSGPELPIDDKPGPVEPDVDFDKPLADGPVDDVEAPADLGAARAKKGGK